MVEGNNVRTPILGDVPHQKPTLMALDEIEKRLTEASTFVNDNMVSRMSHFICPSVPAEAKPKDGCRHSESEVLNRLYKINEMVIDLNDSLSQITDWIQ